MQETFEYPCNGFHDDLPNGKASGKMRIDVTGVHYQIADKRFSMSFTHLHVYLGGASNRLVFFEHPSATGWSVYTNDRSVLNNPHLKKHPEVRGKVNRAKQAHMLGWATGALALLIIVGIPIFLILRMDLLTKAVAEQVPAAWEEELGQSTIAQYRQRNTFMEKEKAEALLKPLVGPLIDAIPDTRYSYDFYIVDNATLNAFALPGGDIVIHSSLILKADTAEELLGVLAHEITHVEEQHGIRNVLGSAGIYIIASAVLGDVSGVLAVLGGAAPLLLNQSYSRRFESESDEKGYALLKRANIDPSGLGRFFNKLIEEEKKRLAEIEDEDTRELVKDVLQFLSTHPASEKRVEQLKELATADDPNVQYRDLSAEFSTLQEAVKQFVTEGEDKEDAVNENTN